MHIPGIIIRSPESTWISFCVILKSYTYDGGIELDDTSHRRPQRRQRDIMVGEVFDSAGLPLVRFDNRSKYSVSEIQEKIEGSHESGDSVPDTSDKAREETFTEDPPNCPKCNVPMVMRTTSKGKKKGQKFWGCPNFPRCREIVAFE